MTYSLNGEGEVRPRRGVLLDSGREGAAVTLHCSAPLGEVARLDLPVGVGKEASER